MLRIDSRMFFCFSFDSIDPCKPLFAASFPFLWSQCHVLMLHVDGAALRCVLTAVSAGNQLLVWPAGDSASKPNTSIRCLLLHLQHLLVKSSHVLCSQHFEVCSFHFMWDFHFVFPLLVVSDGLENVLFLLLFMCILGCVLLMVLLLGYLIVRGEKTVKCCTEKKPN